MWREKGKRGEREGERKRDRETDTGKRRVNEREREREREREGDKAVKCSDSRIQPVRRHASLNTLTQRH